MPSLQLSEFPFESNDLVTPIDVEVGNNGGAFFDNSAEYGYDDFMTDDDDSMRGFPYLAEGGNEAGMNRERMNQGILEQQCRQERMCQQQQHALVPFQ